MMFRRIALANALLFSAIFLAFASGGCGSGPTGAVVKGKVVKKGSPVEVGEKGLIFVSLISEGDKNVKYAADVTPNGAFEVKAGKGVPPGKYKIAVMVIDPYTGFMDPAKDRFKGAYSETATKITREVKAGEELVVDLDAP